jgi:hypothetical protein
MQAAGMLNRRVGLTTITRHTAQPMAKATRSVRRSIRPAVAAVESSEPSVEVAGDAEYASPAAALLEVDAVQAAELEVEELDAAQEQLLSWMLHNDEADQEDDLDEVRHGMGCCKGRHAT